jgi:pSer/pThr/pTyr-binding forkhead associated (FHA) protein
MKVKLIVVGGDAKAAEIKLKLPTVIGRGREANLTLPHPLVSRKHCELFEHAGRLCVRDLGSLNGTYVNNERIADATHLPSGDLLTVGSVTFRAVYADSAAAMPPAAPAEATVRSAASSTTVEPARPAEVRKPQPVAAVRFDAVEEVDQVEEIDEGLEVDERDAAQIEQIDDAPIDDGPIDNGPHDVQVASLESTVPAPVNPQAKTASAPPARFTPQPAAAQQPEESAEEFEEIDDFSSAEVEDFSPPAEFGLESADEDDFINEVDTVEGDEPVVPPQTARETPETVDFQPAPGANRGVGAQQPSGLDEPEDDALNQFFKGLR